MYRTTKFKDILHTHGATGLVAGVIFLNGLVALLSASFDRYFSLGRLNFVLLTDPAHISRSLGLVLGLILIYLATKLLNRSQMAWLMTLFILGLLLLLHFLFGHDIDESIITTVGLILLFSYRAQFQVRNDYELLWQGVIRSVLVLLTALTYGAVGFWLLSRRDFGHDFSFARSINLAIRELILVGTPDLVAHSRYASWFVASLNIAGVTAILLAFLSFFKPLKYRLSTLPREREFVKNLLQKYGHDSEDFFKLWPHDKRYFVFGESALAYKVKGGVAIILGDPIGKKSNFDSLINGFKIYVNRAGWQVSAVHCHLDAAKQYAGNRDKFMVVGSEAVVDIQKFLSQTAKNKHWRNINNRFKKTGFVTELIKPPISSKLIDELRQVSDSWLKLPGREEMTFGLGFFASDYIKNSSILTLRDKFGQLVGFLNLVHSYDPNETNIDLMRHIPGSVNNINDYLCLSLIEILGNSNKKGLNLGLCPLKGADKVEKSSPGSRALKVIYGSNRFFSFQGLVRFKNKFEPEWRERYLVYQNGVPGLIRTALAINKAFRLDK